MRVTPEPDLSDRLDFVVDPDPEAKPCDIDDAVAEFLIAFADGRTIPSRPTPATEAKDTPHTAAVRGPVNRIVEAAAELRSLGEATE